MARKPDPRSSRKGLSVTTLALVRGSMDAVRLAEARVTQDIREDLDPAASLEVHQYLRSASLGLLVAYSLLEGLPDPRNSVTEGAH